jgi:O-antigen/teichoic acid export membrane protein
MQINKSLARFIKSPALKSAGIYTFSNFFAKATAFLLLFIYSNPKYISVNENGLLNLLSSSVFVLMPFLSLGIVQSSSVDFFKLNKDEFKDFFTTSFVMPVIVMLAGIAGLYIFKTQLKTAYGFPLSFIFIIPVLTFLGFCNEQYVSLIRNNDEPFTYFKASMWRLFIEITISVTLVVGFAWRWEGRVTGIMIANIVLFVMAFFYFTQRGYLFGKVKLFYIKEELKYALPIIIMQCSIFCLSASDKFFLSYFSDNNIVGIYGYACVFAAVVTIACSALISYVMPKIYLCLSEPVIDFNQVRKYFNFYAAGSLAALAGVIAVTPFLYRYFINASYLPGLRYMYLIAIGYFLWSIAYFFYSFMLYNKQKKKILMLSLASIFISLLSNYFFIKYWNAQGAAISVCISYFVVLLITLFASKKNVLFMFGFAKTEI